MKVNVEIKPDYEKDTFSLVYRGQMSSLTVSPTAFSLDAAGYLKAEEYCEKFDYNLTTSHIGFIGILADRNNLEFQLTINALKQRIGLES